MFRILKIKSNNLSAHCNGQLYIGIHHAYVYLQEYVYVGTPTCQRISLYSSLSQTHLSSC